MTATQAATPALPNFRDIGGHEGAEGRRVRTGLLYRSVALDVPGERVSRFLADLGLRVVFDLRTDLERDRSPSITPPGARLVVLDVLADTGEADPAALFALMQDPPRASAELPEGATERFYLATYRDLVNLPSARRGFGALLRSLAREDGRPALVHCTTGKDRTGWLVAVLLLTLGVPRDRVMEEYLRSDAPIREAYRFMVDEFVAKGGDRRVIEPLMSVQPAFLEAALDEVQQRYGSLEAYLADGLGLDDATVSALRAVFLEAA
jgi:protein-tyrosine phosphatase